MSGVMFIIVIPRENSENYASGDCKRKFSQLRTESLTSGSSSTSKESKQTELTSQTEKQTVNIHEEISKDPAQNGTRIKTDDGTYDEEFFFSNLDEEQQLDNTTSMEKVLRVIIDRLHIRNATWQHCNSGNGYKISFCLEKGLRCDNTIHMLSEFGIGEKKGSSVAILPCNVYNDKTILDRHDSSSSTEAMFKETSWNRFLGNVRARMNISKVVEEIKSSAEFSFDFIVLLVTAAIIACFGLVQDSTFFLAASMLVSPLMGPILAASFGSVIKDRKLQLYGLASEILGVVICIMCGFVFGLIVCGVDYGFGNTKDLTAETKSRTEIEAVITGIFIALASGAAVSIAVLSDNYGSLAGVAISASLLPPAVNTGLLWSYSLMHLIAKSSQIDNFMKFISQPKYSDHQSIELLILGLISLCMTLTNVLCILIVGKLLISLKVAVAPGLNEERKFWKNDVLVARDYCKTLDMESGKTLEEEFAEYCKRGSANFKGIGAELLRQDYYPRNHTWSPLQHNYRHDTKEADQKTNVMDLYKTFTKPAPSVKPMPREYFLPIVTPKKDTNKRFDQAVPRLTTFAQVDEKKSENKQDDETSVVYGRNRKFVVSPVREQL